MIGVQIKIPNLYSLLVNLTAEALLEAMPPFNPIYWADLAAEVFLVGLGTLVVVLRLRLVDRTNHLLQIANVLPYLCLGREFVNG